MQSNYFSELLALSYAFYKEKSRDHFCEKFYGEYFLAYDIFSKKVFFFEKTKKTDFW